MRVCLSKTVIRTINQKSGGPELEVTVWYTVLSPVFFVTMGTVPFITVNMRSWLEISYSTLDELSLGLDG